MGEQVRNCMYCRHCHFDGGSPGYSEWTPESPMSFRCEKNKWNMDDYANKQMLVTALETARTCELFEADV